MNHQMLAGGCCAEFLPQRRNLVNIIKIDAASR